jgi:hypothetical protein
MSSDDENEPMDMTEAVSHEPYKWDELDPFIHDITITKSFKYKVEQNSEAEHITSYTAGGKEEPEYFVVGKQINGGPKFELFSKMPTNFPSLEGLVNTWCRYRFDKTDMDSGIFIIDLKDINNNTYITKEDGRYVLYDPTVKIESSHPEPWDEFPGNPKRPTGIKNRIDPD